MFIGLFLFSEHRAPGDPETIPERRWLKALIWADARHTRPATKSSDVRKIHAELSGQKAVMKSSVFCFCLKTRACPSE
jgi:hypothetical protein